MVAGVENDGKRLMVTGSSPLMILAYAWIHGIMNTGHGSCETYHGQGPLGEPEACLFPHFECVGVEILGKMCLLGSVEVL